MNIHYNHSHNLHTQDGPCAVMPRIIEEFSPKSILDVGCGRGTWLKAAADLGIQDLYGVDGVAIPASKLLISSAFFAQKDLTKPWNLGRKFDLALCLEVAEHLAEPDAGNLVGILVAHADLIVFSAACPGQEGQHHVNCQWPSYWQEKLNERGFSCSDSLRWQIWDDARVEPRYRQNLFVARRDPAAGHEPRIKSVVHPEIWKSVTPTFQEFFRQIEEGSMPPSWYPKMIPRAYLAKIRRTLKRR